MKVSLCISAHTHDHMQKLNLLEEKCCAIIFWERVSVVLPCSISRSPEVAWDSGDKSSRDGRRQMKKYGVRRKVECEIRLQHYLRRKGGGE